MENTSHNTENKEILGVLFDTITYFSEDQLNILIDGMNEAQAKHIIESALHSCHSRGVFSLLESELVSKAIRTINK